MNDCLFIEGRRNGYDTEQCGKTMTVGEMIDWLSQFDEELPIYLNNDNGYTFGSITTASFAEYAPLTYDQFTQIVEERYDEGGNAFAESWNEYDFNDYVEKNGAMTREDLLEMISKYR